ncbi:flagellar protein FlgN [Chitinimonas arctica]|uniref:Flagellar protein FlgN n=1 Tax=Chitinimonas arctica TaxID=2594795 RepID=A0A516SJ49_9NEIS|nr:flagellar protein FlgN [Chitinimonas arctica]QDQ28185.1 flagellar protein FlgN [Chitinimonas arctica]
MTTPPLLSALQHELEQLMRFIDLLEREQNALIANTLAELEDFAKQKAGYAQTLESLAKERRRLFEVNGVELSPDPPHPLLKARFLPDDAVPAVALCWQQLMQAARQASAFNETNGHLIDTRQQQNQQLMALLQSSQNSTLSYDAYGQPRLSRPGGLISKV